MTLPLKKGPVLTRLRAVPASCTDAAVMDCVGLRVGVLFQSGNAMRYEVFLSYSHADIEFAKRFCDRLDTATISVFRDEKNIDYGDSIQARVLEGISKATYVVVILSKSSHRSSWVPYEIGIARSQNRQIVPYIIDAETIIPSFISDLRAVKNLMDESDFIELVQRERTNWMERPDWSSRGRYTLREEDIEQLVGILEFRSNKIRENLSQYYKYSPVAEYLTKFSALHRQHIHALRQGNLWLAHEIVSNIHTISFELERDEFWRENEIETPGTGYLLRPDAFQRGYLINFYVVGDMQKYSVWYPSDHIRTTYLDRITPPPQSIHSVILNTAGRRSQTE